MIEKKDMFILKCDECGEYLSDGDSYSAFVDEESAKETALYSDWLLVNERHICDECANKMGV